MMSILGTYSSELYSNILYDYKARTYLKQAVYLKEENGKFIPAAWLSSNWNYCESLANFIIRMQGIVLKDVATLENETQFFVAAAHIVFVPFGQEGYDFLKKIVAEGFAGKDVGEFLYEQFVLRSENSLKNLNDEQKEYIKDFFVNFELKDEIICSKPKDVATLACRLYFALDGIESSSQQIRDLIEKVMTPIKKELYSPLYALKNDEIHRIKISDYISRIPVHKKLNEYEENFILEKFGIQEKGIKKSKQQI